MNKQNTPHHEKYDSINPIAQRMIRNFKQSIASLLNQVSAEIQSVTECGCGQGHINRHLEYLLPKAQIKGFDISEDDISLAQDKKTNSRTLIYLKNIYDISINEEADLIVCCEVMEHLKDPGLALKKMASLKAKYYLFSVPNEPLWRILNFARGKYLKDWGNTPDHCNHWSTRKFKKFVSQELEIIQTKKPTPWTMILAKSRS